MYDLFDNNFFMKVKMWGRNRLRKTVKGNLYPTVRLYTVQYTDTGRPVGLFLEYARSVSVVACCDTRGACQQHAAFSVLFLLEPEMEQRRKS